jgi:uncharacterized protein
MQIKNLTHKAVLAKSYKHCRTLRSQARGLMFSGKKAVVMEFDEEQIVPLHMAFVFFPIDVAFLSTKKQVVEIKSDFRPFSYYRPKKKARYIIELPHSWNRKIYINDHLEF